jgi:Arginase family
MSRISVVGVPSSAASYAAGQDLAPAAFRSAGLLEQLIASGLEVHDDGDLPHQAWSPDRDHPLAQNAGQATMSLQQLADRLHPLLTRGDMVLVLGGNCTIALGVMAALRGLGAGAPGLLYVDRHYDINTPESTTDGALDWMGLAHALALPGCLDTLTGAFGRRPLLEGDQVAWLGVEPRMATQWEREQADRLGLHVTTSRALAADPAATAWPRSASFLLGRSPSTSTSTSWTSPMLRWRRAPTAATGDLPSTRPPRRSWRRPEISGCERCRSENSTRPAAPGTLTRFPASSAASPAYSQPRLTDHQSCDGND